MTGFRLQISKFMHSWKTARFLMVLLAGQILVMPVLNGTNFLKTSIALTISALVLLLGKIGKEDSNFIFRAGYLITGSFIGGALLGILAALQPLTLASLVASAVIVSLSLLQREPMIQWIWVNSLFWFTFVLAWLTLSSFSFVKDIDPPGSEYLTASQVGDVVLAPLAGPFTLVILVASITYIALTVESVVRGTQTQDSRTVLVLSMIPVASLVLLSGGMGNTIWPMLIVLALTLCALVLSTYSKPSLEPSLVVLPGFLFTLLLLSDRGLAVALTGLRSAGISLAVWTVLVTFLLSGVYAANAARQGDLSDLASVPNLLAPLALSFWGIQDVWVTGKLDPVTIVPIMMWAITWVRLPRTASTASDHLLPTLVLALAFCFSVVTVALVGSVGTAS